jgi:predicted enzyme related to lactoylglutathione lyase
MDRVTTLDNHAHATVSAPVPGARTVRSLEGALRLLRRRGGSVTSETRIVPGIGSWALVTDHDGTDLVLWENAAAVPA